ncbi:hypothetical protein PG984_013217 [Apiospora sp. TS-2023a]
MNQFNFFVEGLSGYVTEDELRSFFQGFGEITYVKIKFPSGKGCGFVQFVHRHATEMAINQMQGCPIGNSRVRLWSGRRGPMAMNQFTDPNNTTWFVGDLSGRRITGCRIRVELKETREPTGNDRCTRSTIHARWYGWYPAPPHPHYLPPSMAWAAPYRSGPVLAPQAYWAALKLGCAEPRLWHTVGRSFACCTGLRKQRQSWTGEFKLRLPASIPPVVLRTLALRLPPPCPQEGQEGPPRSRHGTPCRVNGTNYCGKYGFPGRLDPSIWL